MFKITVLVVEPGKKPYVKEVENSLKSLSREVGGCIQAVYPRNEPVALICDEESKLRISLSTEHCEMRTARSTIISQARFSLPASVRRILLLCRRI